MIIKLIKEKGESRYHGLVLDRRGGVHHKVFASEDSAREWLDNWSVSFDIRCLEV